MSCYFVKRKGWRYELPLNGTRYTGAWFATKKEAQDAEAKRREDTDQTSSAADSAGDADRHGLLGVGQPAAGSR